MMTHSLVEKQFVRKLLGERLFGNEGKRHD